MVLVNINTKKTHYASLLKLLFKFILNENHEHSFLLHQQSVLSCPNKTIKSKIRLLSPQADMEQTNAVYGSGAAVLQEVEKVTETNYRVGHCVIVSLGKTPDPNLLVVFSSAHCVIAHFYEWVCGFVLKEM